MKFKAFVFVIMICGVQCQSEVQHCGSKSEIAISDRIFGGVEVESNAWPWLVAFVHQRFEMFFCGGSLVSSKHVISAAHCFKNKLQVEALPPQYIAAHVGKHNLSVANEPGSTEHSVWQIILHPDWDFEAVKFDADISVVVLRDYVDLRGNVEPICLPRPSDVEVVGNGTVVGWGKSERSEAIGKGFDPIPSELEVPAVGLLKCVFTLPDFVHVASERTFCAGFLNKSKAPCSGDSGGGFYRRNPLTELFELKGIVSASLVDIVRGCNIEAFSLYTNVANFADWIGKKVEETKEIVWEEIEFDCKECEFGDWTECSHNHPDPMTRNLKIHSNFSNHPKITNAADVNQVKLNFSPSTNIFAGIGETFPNLKTLWITWQSIKFIEKEDFADMTQLEELILTANQIDFLPEDVFSILPNLEKLDLQINQIAKLPETLFTNLRKLKFIAFDSNKIEFLPEDIFFNLENLKTLSLDGNEIKKLPEKVTSNLKKLNIVYISGNKIDHLPKDLFANNLELQNIYAHGNPLETIDVDFTKLPNLFWLNLKNAKCIDFWAYDEEELQEAQQIINRNCTSPNP